MKIKFYRDWEIGCYIDAGAKTYLVEADDFEEKMTAYRDSLNPDRAEIGIEIINEIIARKEQMIKISEYKKNKPEILEDKSWNKKIYKGGTEIYLDGEKYKLDNLNPDDVAYIKIISDFTEEMQTVPVYSEDDAKKVFNLLDRLEKRITEATTDEGKKLVALKKEAKKLIKPIKPAIIEDSYWNGNFYGYKQKNEIYLDGRKKRLSNEEVAELQKYLEDKKNYKELVELIDSFEKVSEVEAFIRSNTEPEEIDDEYAQFLIENGAKVVSKQKETIVFISKEALLQILDMDENTYSNRVDDSIYEMMDFSYNVTTKKFSSGIVGALIRNIVDTSETLADDKFNETTGILLELEDD